MLFCILSYTALTGYDWFAASHVGLRVGYARIALASFLSYGFANSIGFALVIGGAVRLRIYRGQGATPAQVAYLTAICGLTFALSGGLVIGTAMLLAPSVVALALPLDPLVLQLFGAIGIGGVVVYLRWVGERPRSLCLRGVKLALPGAATTVGQLAVGALDLIFAGTALYVLLPGDPVIGWAGFICLFSAAMTLGYLSHVPGGVGIFEALIVIALPDIPAGALLGSLVVYRCLYYLLPLAIASLLLGWFELRCGRLPPAAAGRSAFKSPAGRRTDGNPMFASSCSRLGQPSYIMCPPI